VVALGATTRGLSRVRGTLRGGDLRPFRTDARPAILDGVRRLVRFFRLLLVVLALVPLGLPASASEEVHIYYFWGDGCAYCAEQANFLEELISEYPGVVIHDYEVWYHPENQSIFGDHAAARGIEPRAVPTTFIEERVWVGFDDRIAAEIRAMVVALLSGEEGTEESDLVDLPILGPTAQDEVSLVLATVVIGLVDGFNPCSLWALTVLLALVVRTRSRSRMLVIGGTFLLVTALVYGAFIAGLYTVLGAVTHLGWVRTVVAGLALLLGVFGISDYLGQGKRLSLTIPESTKPSLYRRMRNTVFEQRSLPAVVAATIGLAAGIAILELPCTAGLPVLWADLVSASGADAGAAAGLLGLYLGAYLLDEAALLVVMVIVMRATKLQDRHGQALKLVSGWVMVALAGALLLAPAVMETLTGVLMVFVLAAALAGLTAAGKKMVRPG
jgi:cytochrome c biogenesis protein CcdA/glutaredoxin